MIAVERIIECRTITVIMIQDGRASELFPRARAAQSAESLAPEIVTHIDAPSNRVLLKFPPICIRTIDGKLISHSALLDDGSIVTFRVRPME